MSERIFLRTLLGMNISPQEVDTLLVFRPRQDTRNIDCVLKLNLGVMSFDLMKPGVIC